MKKISIIVPIYKKEDIIVESISTLLRIIEKTCRKKSLDFELIAVVDGILDQTIQKLSTIQHEKLTILSYRPNRGKGFAVRYGMMKASGDFVGFVDSGNDLDYTCIRDLISQIIKHKDIHIVVGSKKHPDSQLEYPLKRKIFTKVYSLFTRVFTGIQYDDSQVGCKIFSRELLDKILPRILVKRYAFDVEILSVANFLGYTKHIDIPVKIDFTIEASNVTNVKEIYKMMWDTVAVFYRLRILNYYHDHNHYKWSESLYDLLSDHKLKFNIDVK